MKHRSYLLLVGSVLLPYGASAQKVQNSDISILLGGTSISPRGIAGTDLTVDGATNLCSGTAYGYQVVRVSAASLWVEGSPGYFAGGNTHVGGTGSVNANLHAFFAGLRLMVPVQSRVALYAAAGGGGGTFSYPVVARGASFIVQSNHTWHGVFEFGGGVDLRLSRFFSIRTEVRDFVTGRGLSGSAGRHHVLPLAGVSFHF